ncbi:MAG: alpha/beta hydrolase [Desulfobacterales bacterium]
MRDLQAGKTFIARFDQYVDTTDFLEWTKQAYPGVPVFVVSHSMGGLIATHFGIRRAENDPDIKGYLLSSPYYANAIKVPPIMIPLISCLE